MSTTNATLHKLLNQLLMPRILDLERTDAALKADIQYCKKMIGEMFSPIKYPDYSDYKTRPFNESELLKSPLNCSYGQIKPNTNRELIKSVNRVSRSKTPLLASNQTRKSSNNRLTKDRSGLLKTKKNIVENSSTTILSIKNSQINNTNYNLTKSFISRLDKSVELNREKSIKRSIAKNTDKTPDSKRKINPSPGPYTKTIAKNVSPFQKTPNRTSINKERSSKNIHNINNKKQEILDTSKTSVTSNTTGLQKDNSKNRIKKISIAKNLKTITIKKEVSPTNYHKTDYVLTNCDISKRLSRNDLDVSNIITLEQDVNDDLLINQKDDKLLLSNLDDDDQNNILSNINLINNNNMLIDNTNIQTDIEEILDDKWTIFSSFLNKKDLLNVMLINKKFCKLCVSKFLCTTRAEISVYEEKLKFFKEKYSETDLNTPLHQFSLSKGSLKAIDLLNTPLYTKIFNTNTIPSDDILFSYQLYFKLLGKDKIFKLKKLEFWSECCNFLIREDEKTGDIISNSVKHFDFSERNIYTISRIVANKEKHITPNYYSKTCATTGLFIFILKDALEYIGILSDKKTHPSLLYRLYKIFLKNSLEKSEKLSVIDRKFQFN